VNIIIFSLDASRSALSSLVLTGYHVRQLK